MSENIVKKRSIRVFTVLMCIGLICLCWFIYQNMLSKAKTSNPPQPQAKGEQIPDVVVVEVGKENAYPPSEYVGHIETIQKVDVHAQVDGYIEKVYFREGGLVKAGDLLFTIQKDRYSAQVALNRAMLTQAKADLARAEKFIKRLQNADKRSIVQAELDTAESDLLQCQAKVQQAKASLDLSEINLGYAEIRAPITGKIGQALVTKGNYVSPATGTLAVITQIDPIRAVFSMTDKEYFTLMNNRDIDRNKMLNIRLNLPDGTTFKGNGKWAFDDNKMDPNTGTIAIRALFDNRDGLLVPLTYVTVVLNNNSPLKLPAVPLEAVKNQTNGDVVFVVNEQNFVEQRPVKLGRQVNGRQIIESGVNEGETVVVQGVQMVRHGQKVHVNENTTALSANSRKHGGA